MNVILGLLRTRRWAEAEVLLRDALERQSAPPGPLLGLLSQSLLEQGRAEEAKETCRQALRTAKASGDQRGLAQLRQLNARIRAELAAATVSAEPSEVEALLLQAQRSRGAEAAALAREAQGLAAGPREEVLCCLALVRAEPDRAETHLRSAHAIADEHEEPQLIAAIANAARMAGVDFGTHRF
ncbi:MAG TPA: hypothetical protein QGF58_23935 [Myxococcota bacterium]|nr:hypothetical protein [Myxococcota bacterium]